MADGEVSLRMSLELAQTLQQMELVIRKEGQHDQAMAKTVGTSKKIVAAMKEMGEQAKSLDQIRGALAAGDEQRLKKRLSLLQLEAKEQAQLRAMEAQRMGDLGRQRMIDRTDRLQGERFSHRMAEGIRLSALEMRQLTPLAKEMAQPIERSASAIERIQRGTGLSVGSLAGYAAGWVGISTAIRIATASAQEHYRVTGEARAGSLSLGQAQKLFLLNTAGESPRDRIAALQRLSTRGKYFTPDQMTEVAASAAAAFGGDVQSAVEAAEATDPLAVGNVPLGKGLAVAAGGISKSTGSADERYNMGLSLLIGKYARPEDPELQARNAAQALSRSSVVTEADPDRNAREVGALWAYFTQVGEDVSGETAAQAASVEAEQMRQFFRDRGIADPGSSHDRVKWFRSHPAESQEFLDTMNMGRERFKPALEELLLKPKSKRVQEFYDPALAGIVGSDPLAVYHEEVELGQTATPQLRQLAIDKQQKATAARADVARSPEALLSAARDARNEAMAKTRRFSSIPFGLRYATEELAGSAGYWSRAPFGEQSQIELMRDTLQTRRRNILETNESIVGLPTPWSRMRQPQELGGREREALTAVDDQLKVLTDILRELKLSRQQQAVNKVSTAMALGMADRAAFMQ